MKKLLSLLAPIAVASAVVSPAPSAEAQIIVAAPLTPISGLVSVAVGCKNPGSSQDVAKTPILTNTSSSAIPKGRTLSWKSSDGDKGSLTLAADLAPGASIRVQGTAGNAYTCSASFIASPDLTIQQPSWNATKGLSVKVANLDKHASAKASTVRVELRSCAGGALLSSAEVQAPSLAAGGITSVYVPVNPPSTKFYLRIAADAKKVIAESNETNNVFDAYQSCIK